MRYFHTMCKELISKLQPQLRNKLLTNIDITATENFFLKAQSMKKIKADNIKLALLGNTTKFLTSMEVAANDLPTPDRDWLKWELPEPAPTQPPAKSAPPPLESVETVRVIKFDEQTGTQLNQHVQETGQTKTNIQPQSKPTEPTSSCRGESGLRDGRRSVLNRLTKQAQSRFYTAFTTHTPQAQRTLRLSRSTIAIPSQRSARRAKWPLRKYAYHHAHPSKQKSSLRMCVHTPTRRHWS